MKVLRPGDQIHIAALARIGLSIVHDDFLVAAAGPAEILMQLPLGEITLRWATEEMGRRFRPVILGGTYRMLPCSHPEADRPIEIIHEGASEVFWWGRPQVGPFEAFIRETRRRSGPIVSFERRRICPETAAHTSAELLDRHGYDVIAER